MIENKLSKMTKGWFVGAFSPTVIFTRDVEVGIKYYKSGEQEQAHFHKVATEVTVVLTGKVRMNDRIFVSGDIITVSPGETVSFSALEDSTTVVVKVPGASNDKYISTP